MKKSKIIYLIILCATFSSCGDWLSVNPQDQIKEEELYSSADGFHNQINGIYKVMSEASMYGRELSFGLIDVLAQVYNTESTAASDVREYQNAATYSFLSHDATKQLTINIWEKGYNAIANCNSVIRYAVDADSMMFRRREIERQCILGEAYALRAMLHFDILRTYAPSPVINSSGSFLSYVKDFPIHFPTPISTKEYLENVIEDLQKAHDLTKLLDSASNGIGDIRLRLELTGNDAEDRFLSYRGYRLNYYAVKALLARVYLYAGMEREALDYANQLIEVHEKSSWFSYNRKYDFTDDGNAKFYGDIIFSLYNNLQHKRFEEVNTRIDESTSSNYLTLNDYESIFGAEAKADYRALQYKLVSEDYVPIKYAEVKEGSKADKSNRMIPMLRMSEMYYIAAECLYDTDPTKAAAHLAYVRKKRGASAALPIPSKKEEFILQILNDVRREQVGEGQLFFFYKRLNLPVFTKDGKFVAPGKGFMLPIPDSNTIF